MGILSVMMNRNLLFKLKPLSSSNPCHIRRLLSAAATVPTTDALDGDLNPITKPMFLIERLHEGCPNYYLLSAADDSDSSWKDHLHPISNPFSSEHALYGSCKEWTLFINNDMSSERDSRQRRVSLWNPTTKRIQTLPRSFLPRPRPVTYIDIQSAGFGFDPKSQDYKVICFLHYDYEDYGDSFCQEHCEVYSFKTGSWKQVPDPLETPFRPAVHVNGVHYWATLSPWFLSFDFVDEKFSLIPHPGTFKDRGKYFCGYDLVEFYGLPAALVHTDLLEEDNNDDEPFSFEVWVWNGKTWSSGLRKVTIGDDVLAGDRVANVLGFFQNDYLFFQGRNKGELMLFNVKTSKLENLGIYASLEPTMMEYDMLRIFPFFVPT